MAKPHRYPTPPYAKRGIGFLLENENDLSGLELIWAHPSSFPLEFTSKLPLEVTVERTDTKLPAPAEPNDIDGPVEDALPPDPNRRLANEPSSRRYSMDRSGAHGLNEPVRRTRQDGTKVVDTHPLEDPSTKYY